MNNIKNIQNAIKFTDDLEETGDNSDDKGKKNYIILRKYEI